MSDYLKELSAEFNENLKLNYDLKKMNWFNKILIGTLGGYMAYVFVLATINTICDCI